MMQANFDTAHDARYSIARDTVWAAYMHPLGSLQKKDFYSALTQVVTLAENYGTSYSSGLFLFKHGDTYKKIKQKKKGKNDIRI